MLPLPSGLAVRRVGSAHRQSAGYIFSKPCNCQYSTPSPSPAHLSGVGSSSCSVLVHAVDDDDAARQQAPTAETAAGRLDLPFESEIRTFSGGSTGGADAEQGASNWLGPSPVPSGTMVHDRYMIKEVVGRGANATTYLATDKSTGNPVALKAMSLKAIKDWKQLELFQREAVVLQSLSHPGIPQYIDYFEEDTSSDRAFYIVQELVKGKSLAQLISSGQRATEEEVLHIATDLLSILRYLSGLRPAVIHRDIKPENVVLEGNGWGGRVYLIDFGGVQGTSGLGDMGSTIVGTYGYMAPEQFAGQASTASDLYSLGATLLYLVSGQPPGAFPSKRMRIEYKDRVSVGPVLSELLDGLLQPVAEDRLTPQEALDIVTGKAARRRSKAAAQQQQQQWQQPTQSARSGAVRLPDGSLYRPPSVPTGPVRKPAGSRVVLENAGGKLDVDIPPQRFSSSNLGTGLFALAWNAFVAFWTFSALASGGILFALFSAPFWFAGYQLAGQALGSTLTHERFAIGRKRWRLAQELAVFRDGERSFSGTSSNRAKQVEGDVSDLTGARVVTTIIVNGVPQTAIELVEGVRKLRFGESLETSEQEWLVWEINQKVAELRGSAPTLSDMGPEDAPDIYDDTDPTRSGMTDIDPFFDPSDRRADPFRDRDQFWRR